MAGLDTRTGNRNAAPPPKRVEDIKQLKTQPVKAPISSVVQTVKQPVKQPISSSSGTASSITGTPQTQLNFNDQQALMMSRARGAAQQDYNRDLDMAQSFGQTARAREVNNRVGSFQEEAAKQYTANDQAVRVASNLASSNQTSQRQAENAAAQLSAAANATQSGIVYEQQTQESQRQSSINASQERTAETQGMYSLLGSLNNSFSQGGYKYW